ncbi:MAG TPA: hypothetical protein PLV70_11155 [Flavobacteriales bacterium]|nr:hypothetical protein [Flavobacteriales bacterium]HRN37295.1 hypothetical protein [Flavobacteriales bacterium]HRO40495.1 hypothetical protein [Flavobacteriales bacterium]HRP81704.1 hypothetical protein [Flavobacteriales bacterium]HRQ85662.1 hypothetical protein [Flavobacteriales bacterium]
MRFDKVAYGYILGIITPIAGLLAYSAFAVTVLRPELELDFLLREMLFGIRGNIAPTLSLSVLADAGLFFAFDRWRMLKAMRGVIGAMLTYGAVIVLLLLLWERDFM